MSYDVSMGFIRAQRCQRRISRGPWRWARWNALTNKQVSAERPQFNLLSAREKCIVGGNVDEAE
jgi:hypothetical protein